MVVSRPDGHGSTLSGGDEERAFVAEKSDASKRVAAAGTACEGRPGVRLDEVRLLWYRAEPPKRFGIDPVVLCNAVG